ncbi:MAG TPA: carbamoyltransferase HypF [Candidatus Angelobacter sp.]|nr:carbamoyltransferase HypF [Candidatus Angelobacter sp.]
MKTITACSIRVRGVVQGVGFRPFVYRLAQANALAGWVLNGEQGVEIHLEGSEECLQGFIHDLKSSPPPAAKIAEIQIEETEPQGLCEFTIRESIRLQAPTVRISPDLPVCDDCVRELFDPKDHRYLYPYINCTNCGPRYTVILRLPYDRPNTTMKQWPLGEGEYCAREYHDPANRRFHAQPVACAECGPGFCLREDSGMEIARDHEAITRTAELLKAGKIVAIKGLGGYHLACDALNADAVTALRERKYRKEKPFAIMLKDEARAAAFVRLTADDEALLRSTARPIVLAPAKGLIPGIAPGNNELGVMLPYTPLQHLLFAAGAPDALVMTSANRSSEPISYEDDDALDRLSGIADAFLIGERPIARRVDDSVVRAGAFGPVILRRARGYAPGSVTTLPTHRPILAVGADLKNTVTLVVHGQAFVSQHIGDLEHYQAHRAFQEVIQDLVSMYEVSWDDLVVVHDAHPQYLSTAHALSLRAAARVAVQHHRAHVASVLGERGEWEKKVLGVSFDGTGYGDDESIWGGEIFAGSVNKGFERVAHLRRAHLPGGDAAAHFPVQAAAGFLAQLDSLPADLMSPPFHFDSRYNMARQLVAKDVRSFGTTSVGRLFDTAAALLGFTRGVSFEGQAAMWLEQIARNETTEEVYPFPFTGDELDFRPLLNAVIHDRLKGTKIPEIARAFQRGLAQGLSAALVALSRRLELDTVVLSGGVFQNELLLEDLKSLLPAQGVTIWTNQAVPPNDGGISLGQAALAAFAAQNEAGGLNT